MSELKWVLYKNLPDVADVGHARLVDGDLGTKYFLRCDKHWDTGAPDEWIITKGAARTSFPSQSEAKSYAEATYTLEKASHGV